jgi:hypothetical protein
VISPAPPRAELSLPWDDPDQTHPVAALAAARADLGDTFEVARLGARYDLTAEFTAVRPMAEQIGGVGRAADPCPIAYVSKSQPSATREGGDADRASTQRHAR